MPTAFRNPRHSRAIEDPAEREEAVERERNLLYAAMTRARDDLVVTWAGKPTEFLEDVIGARNA